MRLIPHTVSPATVISCMALAVALGGTSYAAVALPPNSVGTAQLKPNAVTGAKVKDGSLLATDFKAGQLPAPGVPDVVVRTLTASDTAAGVSVGMKVMCEEGEAALGGGAGQPDVLADGVLEHSYPLEADESAAEAGDTPVGLFSTSTTETRKFVPV